jgi:hypothetical protein
LQEADGRKRNHSIAGSIVVHNKEIVTIACPIEGSIVIHDKLVVTIEPIAGSIGIHNKVNVTIEPIAGSIVIDKKLIRVRGPQDGTTFKNSGRWTAGSGRNCWS